MPLVAPTPQEYSRLCFRASVHYARDAVVALAGRRYVGSLISCQHSWEMAGKAALAVDAAFSWPPPPGNWMRRHDVMANIKLSCTRLKAPDGRLKLPKRAERALLKLETWLPPGPHLANPPVNTEYVFDAGTTWLLPVDHFGASHTRIALEAIQRALHLVKEAYRTELRGLSARISGL